MAKYKITKSQLEELTELEQGISWAADALRHVCSEEHDRPDINYGFQIGQIYNDLRSTFHRLTSLRHEIGD